ncbi:uncharacterized protein N7483_002484 [Penicillium malachiteum]|uniref:uncharacterized protein n=1 Tax=Penicillium malachiteum TaxID=1324776 RepID=UPI00254769E5|nr:uncharacterized protein N7483_002484 [Penicillium malachiteum]KAJ5737359.1 hypothetical protein N7483_002484 [Penicillium malachiteum]
MQLWLFSLRHFVQKQNEFRRVKYDFGWSSEGLSLFMLGDLANRLGFSSRHIHQLCARQENVPGMVAKGFISSLYKGDSEASRREIIDSLSNQIGKAFENLADSDNSGNKHPKTTTGKRSKGTGRRFNAPSLPELEEQASYLFLPNIVLEDQARERYPTSWVITKDILACFISDLSSIQLSTQKDSHPVSSEPLVDESYPEPNTEKGTTPDLNQDPLENENVQIPSPIIDESSPRKDTGTDETNNENLYSPSIYTDNGHESDQDQSLQEQEAIPTQVNEGSVSTPADESENNGHLNLVPGFEDSYPVGPLRTELQIPTGRTVPEILQTWFQAPEGHTLIVLFLFESRRYYKFGLDDEDTLETTLKTLAEGYNFFSIDPEFGFVSLGVNEVLQSALDRRILLVGRINHPKVMVEEGGMTMSVETLKGYVQKNKKRKYRDIEEVRIRGKDGEGRPRIRRRIDYGAESDADRLALVHIKDPSKGE